MVGFYRKDTGKGGITYAEALDEALCWGWIDGIRRRHDDVSYTIRFTPRRAGSIWSAANLRHWDRLDQAGRVRPPGRKAREAWDGTRAPYSFEHRNTRLSTALAREFRARRTAWLFFQRQPPGYRRTAIFWVMSAKRETTRTRRLGVLIEHSRAGERLPQISASRPSAQG